MRVKLCSYSCVCVVWYDTVLACVCALQTLAQHLIEDVIPALVVRVSHAVSVCVPAAPSLSSPVTPADITAFFTAVAEVWRV